MLFRHEYGMPLRALRLRHFIADVCRHFATHAADAFTPPR